MTQPPDGRPPEPPAEPATEPPSPAEPASEPPPAAEAPIQPPPAEPPARPNPIISATDEASAPASGWVSPTAPPAPATGWALPEAPRAAPGRDGYVIAGVGARLVAFLIDALLVSIVPTILTLVVIDFASIWEAAFEAARRGAEAPMMTTFPVTLDVVLVTLVGVGIHFIYFIGFWTSGGRATPGMRGLRMQVVDAMSGQRIGVVAAVKRWIPLGSFVSVVALLEPLQAIAGPLSLLLLVVVFITIVADARNQGLHDRWANTLVIRSATSGNGAVAVGCLVLALLMIGLAIVASILAFSAILPFIDLDNPGGGIAV